MKQLLTSIFLFLTTLTFAQESLNNEMLLGCWTDSREESTTDIKIFRPCDYKSFPPSRFRFRMVLKDNHECDWLYLAPNDAHRMKKGTWKLNEDTKELTIISIDEEKIMVFVVIDVNELELKIKNI